MCHSDEQISFFFSETMLQATPEYETFTFHNSENKYDQMYMLLNVNCQPETQMHLIIN